MSGSWRSTSRKASYNAGKSSPRRPQFSTSKRPGADAFSRRSSTRAYVSAFLHPLPLGEGVAEDHHAPDPGSLAAELHVAEAQRVVAGLHRPGRAARHGLELAAVQVAVTGAAMRRAQVDVEVASRVLRIAIEQERPARVEQTRRALQPSGCVVEDAQAGLDRERHEKDGGQGQDEPRGDLPPSRPASTPYERTRLFTPAPALLAQEGGHVQVDPPGPARRRLGVGRLAVEVAGRGLGRRMGLRAAGPRS